MAAGMGDQFCLRWNNYHFNMTSVVNQLLADEAFVDVTLSCEGARIKAHRVVLSACSPYFQRVLMDNPCKHPVLILPVGVGHADLRAIVEFIYRGETYVTRDQLSSIVRVAELLKIKGLCEVSQQQTEPQNANNSSSITSAGITQVAEHHMMVTNSVQTTYGKPVTELSTQAATHTPNVGNQQQNNVVVSVTSSQNAMQQGNQASGQQQQQPTTPRPNYTSLYRGRSRGRRPVGNFPSRGGWGSNAATGGEKRNAAQANLGPGNSGGLRRPVRGSYRGAWQGRSPMKNAGGTGGGASSSNEDNTLGSDIMEESNNVQMRQDSDHGVDDSSVGYHDNTSSESHPPASTNLDAQNLYGPPTNMEHLANHGAWSHMTHQSGHNFSPSANSASSATTNQERAFKTEPEQANDFAHPNSRPPSQEVNTPTSVDNDRNGHEDSGDLTVTPEILGLMPSHITLHPTGGAAHHHLHHSSHSQHHHHSGMNVTIPVHPETTSKKMYTPEAMEAALESLRSGTMSLSRAAAVYGIPSTTLWQRAHRLGIDTPMKKDPSSRHWSEDDLRMALEALRAGRISANRASKEYGIPSSTLYKIARKEGIKLAAPFNASPTNWSPEDLVRALEAIRGGMSVQRAATQFGIPSGTLYGRCKREGIELVHKSYSGDRPWSDSSMSEAMESVRSGEMSINQAAIHYNVPYSSLYNRIKRIKALEEMGEGYDASLAEGTNHPEEEVYEEDMDEEDPMMMGSSDHGPNGPPGANTTSPPAGHGHPMASGQSTSSFAPHNSYMSGHMSLPIPITMDYQNFSQGNPTQNPPPPNAAAYQQ